MNVNGNFQGSRLTSARRMASAISVYALANGFAVVNYPAVVSTLSYFKKIAL